MSLIKSVEEPNGSKEDINSLNPQEQVNHSDEAEMFDKNSDSCDSSGGESTEFFLVDEVTSENDSLEPEEMGTESNASEMNVKSSDLEKDELIKGNKSPDTFCDDVKEVKKSEGLPIEDQHKESIPETESSLLTKSGDSEGVGQIIDELEEKDDVLNGKDNTLQMLVKPRNVLEEAGESIILTKDNEHIDKEKLHEVEIAETILDGQEEFDATYEQQDKPSEDEVSGKESDFDEFLGESPEFILVAEDTCDENLEPEETRTESDASDTNLKSSDLEKDESIQENKSPTFWYDLKETKKCEDLSIEDQYEVIIPDTESLILTKSGDPEQVVQNIGQCEDKDTHIDEENVLNDEDKVYAFLCNEKFDDITSQDQDESAKETNAESVMSHLTMEAASLQSSDTEKSLPEAVMEGINSSEATDQSLCHLTSEWHVPSNWNLSKETALREKRHLFIKTTVLLDAYGTYFESTCSFLRTDKNIKNSIAFIDNLVCKDCRRSEKPSVLLRSLGLIQALLLNLNCELTIQQLRNFIDHLIFCLHTNPSPHIRGTFSHMVALLVTEITKGQDPVHQEIYLEVVDFIERIILEEPNLQCGIYCNLIESVLSMGFVAVYLLMPKVFPKLCKMVDDSLNSLNSMQEGNATGLFFDTQNSTKEFNWKMSDALDLYGKLLDACELLMKMFFLENFTHSDVFNLFKSSQGSFFNNNSYSLKLKYKQLGPFFKDCLEYFGEALTARLSLICTQYNCARYLKQLFADIYIYTCNNTFMNCNLFLHTWKNKVRKRRETENTSKPPCTKGQWLFDSSQIKTMFGESRCGLIHLSASADVCQRRDYETLQNSSTLSHVMKSKSKGLPPVSKRKSNEVLGEKPKVLCIPIKDFLRNRGIDKYVHKSILSGPSKDVVEQMDISNVPSNDVVEQIDISDVSTSCGSVATDTSSVENVPLPSDPGSCIVGTKQQQYLQSLKAPPNLSTLWLDKLNVKYRYGHKLKPLHWKYADYFDVQ